MKKFYFFSILLLPCMNISAQEVTGLSDTSTYAKDKWKDNIKIDLNASPGTQRELRRETTPVGKVIEQPYSDDYLLFSLSVNYRNNIFLGGFETFGTHFNGAVVGVNAFAWNFMTPEIDFFFTLRGGYSRKAKERFDLKANPYWGFGGEFYIDNLHIGIAYINRIVDETLEPDMLKRYNMFLFIGYSFNRNSFKKK